jgi:diacylglycerol kinase family enzyme
MSVLPSPAPAAPTPSLDPAAPLLFLVNAAAGAVDVDAKRAVIAAALAAHGRHGDLQVCGPHELAARAAAAAGAARERHTAVIAVGGDGTQHTVAQACHEAGCAMGVMPYGTFNYFARTHGMPTEPQAAARWLMRARPRPVQVGAVNDRLFLVNASLGIYPELLQDRERFKARFGRSRWVAALAAVTTLLRAQRRLRLHIELHDGERDLQTLTLFVGNNRLQLRQWGAEPADTLPGAPGHGSLAALMLRPVGTWSMIGLMLQGAMGRLREAAGVESLEFHRMVVRPRIAHGHRHLPVALDGEVTRMRAPLDIRALDRPLFLLQCPQSDEVAGSG